MRCIQKSKGGSIKIWAKHIRLVCEKAKKNSLLSSTSERVSRLANEVADYILKYPETLQVGAREYAFSLYRLFTGFYLNNFYRFIKNKIVCNLATLIIDRCLKTSCKESDLYLLKK